MFRRLRAWLDSRRRRRALREALGNVSMERPWTQFDSWDEPANTWHGKLTKKDRRWL